MTWFTYLSKSSITYPLPVRPALFCEEIYFRFLIFLAVTESYFYASALFFILTFLLAITNLSIYKNQSLYPKSITFFKILVE